MTTPIQRSWNLGYILLLIPPFLGLANIVFELPRWLEIVTVVAILALVYSGSRLLFWGKTGGWRPSTTLPDEDANHDR